MSTEKSKAQIDRDALMDHFEQQDKQSQQVIIVTYSGILSQMIDIYNVKHLNNGKCEFAELGKSE